MERITAKGREAVVDVRWDNLSEYYLLAVYASGDISLWDMQRSQELQTFARQDPGVCVRGAG